MGYKQHVDLYVDHDSAAKSFRRDEAGRVDDPRLTKELEALKSHVTDSVGQTQKLRPVNQLTNVEIVVEARELHSQFKQLSEQYNQAPAPQRAHLREEMEPLVNRERELRQEYTGRATPELSRDRVPEQQIAFGR
jgi:hypothetical protein